MKKKPLRKWQENLRKCIEDEIIDVDEDVSIKESTNHPLDNIIGNFNQRTLRSQPQNKSNFFCFISMIEPKNISEVIKDGSWVVAMKEEFSSPQIKFGIYYLHIGIKQS